MNFDYWQGRLADALEKARASQSARTTGAYLELAAHYRSMADLAQRHDGQAQGKIARAELVAKKPSGAPTDRAMWSLAQP